MAHSENGDADKRFSNDFEFAENKKLMSLIEKID